MRIYIGNMKMKMKKAKPKSTKRKMPREREIEKKTENITEILKQIKRISI